MLQRSLTRTLFTTGCTTEWLFRGASRRYGLQKSGEKVHGFNRASISRKHQTLYEDAVDQIQVGHGVVETDVKDFFYFFKTILK